MQVAADVVELDAARGGSPANGGLAQLGRTPRDAEPRVERVLVRRVGQRLERARGTPRSRSPARARCRSAAGRRRRADRDAVDGHADRRALALGHQRDDRAAAAAKRAQHRARVAAGAHDRELLARVAPAPRVAGDLAAEDVGDARRPARGRWLSSRPGGGAPRARARARRASRASVFGPIPGARRSLPAQRRRPQLVGGTHVERPRELQRPPRAQARGSARGRSGRARAHASSSASSAISPVVDELAQPRLDARADPAQLAHAPAPARARPRRRAHARTSPPHAGTRAPCTDWRRRAPAARQTRRGARRSARSPSTEALRIPRRSGRAGGCLMPPGMTPRVAAPPELRLCRQGLSPCAGRPRAARRRRVPGRRP